MMSLTFGLFSQVSGSGPLGPFVEIYCLLLIFVEPAWGKARHSCYYFAKMHVRVWVHPDLSGL